MGQVKTEDLPWLAGAYLVLRAVRSNDGSGEIIGVDVVKVVKNYPALGQDEIAVRVEVSIPEEAFTPALIARVDIPKELVGEKIIQAQVL
jgi:hypothetical protein